MAAHDADSQTYSIEVTTAEALVPLRHAILRPTLTVADARFPGDLEATTIHLAAIVRGRVLGCASFMAVPFEGREAYQLRGMATDPVIRGAGQWH
ncbi:MAG: hypothetical protein H0W83_02880 [Planctomycetes bacterium]|nr:hypothetical protein [Planctomycetota bacterium]